MLALANNKSERPRFVKMEDVNPQRRSSESMKQSEIETGDGRKREPVLVWCFPAGNR